MPINILNRFGPLSFKSQTNNTENLSINSLLSNFYNPGSNNFSISQSYYQLENRIGNSSSDTKTISITNPLGAGFINKDDRRPIKFSEFYGASFFSSSFKIAASTGVATVKVYSPSVIQNNNFLTNNIQDKVYQYTLYSKSDVTTPIVDSGWNKIFSYAKSGDNIELFYNLVDTKAYKLVAKDCLSNAFSSSMFIGTCASSVTDNTTYSYTMTAADLPTASSLLLQKINSDKTTNGYTNTKITDLSNILNNLNNLLQNPNISTYKSSGQLLPSITYKDNLGYNRTLNFDGLIIQKSNVPNGPLGYFYTGLVTATSSGGTNSTYEYSFENTSTFGQITLYILGTQDSSGVSCTAPPAKIGNFPTNISFTGPRCGYLDCGDGYTQPVCNPTSTTQIRHSGSFIITNNNNDEMLATISPTWTKLNGDPLDSLVSTVVFNPSGMFSIAANSVRKVSIGFGLSNYQNESQPTTFTAKGSINLVLPLGYSPQSQNCEIIATFDKNSCNISLPIKQIWITPSFWQPVGVDELSCNANPNSAQIVSNPTSTTQVRHSGSFTITNNLSVKPISITFNKNNWKNYDGTTINSLLTPIEMNPDSPITLQPNESKKISVSFGKNNYNNPSQPADVNLICPFTATTDSNYYINPISENTFYFSSDKNSCVVTALKTPNWPLDIGMVGGANSIDCNCGTDTSPQICDPTLSTQIKHTGSFVITNNNPDSMTITLNQNWTNYNDGSSLNPLLLPVTISPQSPILIDPYKSKKVSIGVGIANYSNENQPSSIDIKNLAVATLPPGYTETSKNITIKFLSDKDKCRKQVVVPITPPIVTPVTSNIGCVNYNSLSLQNWGTVKSKIAQIISNGTGTTADKTFAKAVVNALPSSGCNLPSTYTQDGNVINITWTLDNAGEQTYVCTPGTSGQFAGSYTVNTSNSTLGTANFYILFLRKNDNNFDAESYINICQRGGVSSPSGGGCPASWMMMETLESGFIPAREIKVGMHLRGPDENEWNKVTVAYEDDAPIWSTTINGDIYDVDDSHLWYIGNDAWKCVKSIVAGDTIEGAYGHKYIVDKNELLMPLGKYMHLNCENRRFLMNGKVIGHNFPETVTMIKKK